MVKYSFIIFLVMGCNAAYKKTTFKDLIIVEGQSLKIKTFVRQDTPHNPFIIIVENAKQYTVTYMNYQSIDELKDDGRCIQQSLYLPVLVRSINDNNYKKAVYWDMYTLLLLFKYQSIKLYEHYFSVYKPDCKESLAIIGSLLSMNIIVPIFEGALDYYWLNIPQAHSFSVISDYWLMTNKK